MTRQFDELINSTTFGEIKYYENEGLIKTNEGLLMAARSSLEAVKTHCNYLDQALNEDPFCFSAQGVSTVIINASSSFIAKTLK